MTMATAGTYRARGVTAALCETKSGKEQLAIEFVLFDNQGMEGEHVTYFGSFSDAAWDITIRALRTCGWTGADLSDLSGVDANEVSLVLEEEEWEGRTRVKVRWVNAPNQGMAIKAPLAADKAKAFAAQMRARILAMDAQSGARPQARPAQRPAQPSRGGAQAPEPPPINEDPKYTDDMPF